MFSTQDYQEFESPLEFMSKTSKYANGLVLTIAQSKSTLNRESSLLKDQEVQISRTDSAHGPSADCLWFIRQTREELIPSFSLLFPPLEKNRQYRAPSWRTQKRGHSPDCQDHHQQLDHWCYAGIQIQNAICLCAFPHQRQYRQ